jgi:hypothetical protein
MITFRKFAAASDGKLVRMYFTEARLGPQQAEQTSEVLGRQLEPGARLTSYYTGRDAGPAWRQDMPLSVARALGINSHHAPKDEELDRLFEGKRADTGEAWSKHKREISGYDFTFSPHKSVTLAAEFAQDPAEAAAIRNAIYRANDAAMRYIAREIGWARRGRAGENGADPGAVGWVSFRHYIARPTLPVQDGREGATYLLEAPIAGDPHDHIHNALFNLVVTGEGHIGSLDTQRLHARVHEFGAFAQAVLADELRALGIRVAYDDKEQAAVILAVPQFANEAFSKSTHQVLRNAKAFAAGQGLDWDDISAEKKAEILREAAAAARLAKHGEKTDHKIWRDQAEAMGWEHSTVMEDARIAALSNEERFERAYAFAAKHLAEEFHTAAVIDHDRLRVHAARGLIGAGVAGGVKDIDRVVELIERKGIELHGEHVDLVAAWAKRENPEDEPRQVLRVTNSAQIRVEENFRNHAARAALDTSGALAAADIRQAVEASGLDFDSEPEHGAAQKAAIYALGQGGALSLLTGVAGAGKSTLLRPLVAAWKADTRFDASGRELVGVSTAWRQADQLQDAGIAQTRALEPFLKSVEAGEFMPTRNTILVIDEISQIAPRPMLRLLELQAETGMTIKALGDREQAQAIEAGDTIEILRRALPKSAQPELLTAVRQVDRRDRQIAGMFRDSEADAALAMKRDDGTAMLVGGDFDQVAAKIADFYVRRRDILNAAGSKRGITISAPTNEDAAAISMAIRTRLKGRGEIGADETIYKAIAPRGAKEPHAFDLPIATGDHLRLYRYTWSKIDGKDGPIGYNGHVVKVMGKTAGGLLLQNAKGQVGEVEWRRLIDPVTKRLMLGFGHALTIDAAQGVTSDEHIDTLPRGSAGITAFKAYVAESRARGTTWTMISEAAVFDAEKRSRALGDAKPIESKDLWKRVAADMASKPYKSLALDLVEACRRTREQSIDSFIEQGRTFHRRPDDAKDPGRKARERMRSKIAADEVAPHVAAIAEAAKRNAAILDDALASVESALRSKYSQRLPDYRSIEETAPANAPARPSSPSPGA